MEINELRVGNYVSYNTLDLEIYSIENKYPRADSRYDNEVLVDLVCDGFITAKLDEVKGIPLNEGILLNCGFEKINHISGYIFYSFDRNYKREKFAYMPLDVYLNPNYAKIANFTFRNNIEYVHQLQNLFYAINGIELNINL